MPSSRDRFVRSVRGLNPPELGSGGGRGRTGWGMDWDVEAELESIPVLPSPPQSMPAHQQEHPGRLQRGWVRSISSQRLLLLCSLEIRNSPRAGRWEHSSRPQAQGYLLPGIWEEEEAPLDIEPSEVGCFAGRSLAGTTSPSTSSGKIKNPVLTEWES